MRQKKRQASPRQQLIDSYSRIDGFISKKTQQYNAEYAAHAMNAPYIQRIVPAEYVFERNRKVTDYAANNADNSGVPVFYISSTPDFGITRKMMTLGADDFRFSPVDIMELILSIGKRLQKKKALEDQINKSLNTPFEENILRRTPGHFIVTIGCKLKLVRFSDVVCITAQKEYSLIRTRDSKEISVRRSLRAWTRLLPQHDFLQIHRSTIINIEAIEKITKMKDRSYIVFLKGIEKPFCLGQRFMNIMRRTFPKF